MSGEGPARAAGPWERVKAALPYLLTATLFAAGAYALHRLLAPTNFRDVMAQVRATPPATIAMALAATFGAYAALVGYDWSALRYLGKRLPLPTIALGSFLGYAFANTIGLSAVSGAAVRYRIYSSLGLTGYDIAAIATFVSLAYGFGASIIGLAAVAVHPEALDSVVALDHTAIRILAVTALLVTIAALAWLARRRIGVTVKGVRITAPSPAIMTGQLLFTAIDLVLAATALWVLLPPSSLGLLSFVAIFAAAMMAGIMSHVPGGVGVFETVVIAALPAEVAVDKAAAALLLFRLVYYVVPFVLALIVLSLTELRLASGRALGPRLQVLAPVLRAVTGIVPVAMSTMVLGTGLLMMFASLVPPTSELAEGMERWLPFGVNEGGALLSSAIGAVLIVLAHGLLRRLEGAYALTLIALAGGIVAALLNGLDWPRALLMALALLILLPTRHEFYRRTRLTRDTFSLPWLLLLVAVILSAIGVYLFAHQSSSFAHEGWWQFALDRSAPRAWRAGLIGSLILGILALILALRPARVPSSLPTARDLDHARQVIDAQDAPLAGLAMTGDKCLLFSDSGRAFLMYRVQGRSWIALGDPVGDPADAAQLCWTFVDAAMAANGRPVFYETSAAHVPLWVDLGLALHKLGEEAVVPLAGFTLEGAGRKRLRAAHARAERDGLSFDLIAEPDDRLIAALRPISDAWLAARDTREKQFSVGRFEPAYLASFPVAIVRHEDRIVAFANVLTTASRKAATIDLMRHRPDAPAGVMEFLFTELILTLRDRGYGEFSLGMAPFAGIEAHRHSPWSAKLGAFLYRHGGHFYNFEGLRTFKDKFAPEWRPRYLAVPPKVNMLAVATDAAALIGGGLPGVIAK